MSVDEDFVNVWNPASGQPGRPKDFYKLWVEEASASYTSHEKIGYEMLKKYFPNHSIVMADTYGPNLLAYKNVVVSPLEDSPLLTEVDFWPAQKRENVGFLVDNVKFGGFRLAWDKFDFILYIVTWPIAYGWAKQYYLLHEGPDEEPARKLFFEAGAWFNELHEEIWVFDQGYFQKDRDLWVDVQKGNWDDVILKPEFKRTIQDDIYGFWKSEKVYKDLGVPWKRGIIMHGPPGNGKTISLKAIMKECSDKGFIPIYVKSLQSWQGEEGAMRMIFTKARQLAPSVIVFEDIDSLINDRNRSYFLNQVDGLSGNDGLLLIGTTNHFDQLDPGLSSRPSRFDRKYLFDDPDRQERRLYCRYWQKKLSSNHTVEYTDDLAWEITDLTNGFSFAYLKEAHVSALVTLAGGESKTFEQVVKNQIEELKKQISKDLGSIFPTATQSSVPPQVQTLNQRERDIRILLDSLSDTIRWSDPKSDRIYQTRGNNEKDIRALLDALAARTDGSSPEAILSKLLESTRSPSTAYDGNVGGKDIRLLLDTLEQKNDRGSHMPKIFDIVPPPARQTSQQRQNEDLGDLLRKMSAMNSFE